MDAVSVPLPTAFDAATCSRSRVIDRVFQPHQNWAGSLLLGERLAIGTNATSSAEVGARGPNLYRRQCVGPACVGYAISFTADIVNFCAERLEYNEDCSHSIVTNFPVVENFGRGRTVD